MPDKAEVNSEAEKGIIGISRKAESENETSESEISGS